MLTKSMADNTTNKSPVGEMKKNAESGIKLFEPSTAGLRSGTKSGSDLDFNSGLESPMP
jgi:hypothetical protein